MVTPFEQRSYPGAAPDTTLLADITAGALGFNVAAGSGSGYPDGSNGPFFVVIDYDTSTTEKVHCTARTGDGFTVDARGADGTVAQPHASGAKVRACWTATDAQEANRASAQTVGQVSTKGDLLAGTGSNTLGRVAAGVDNAVLVADSTQTTGVTYRKTLAGLTLTAPTVNAPQVTGGNQTGVTLDGTSVISGKSGAVIAAAVNITALSPLGTVASNTASAINANATPVALNLGVGPGFAFIAARRYRVTISYTTSSGTGSPNPTIVINNLPTGATIIGGTPAASLVPPLGTAFCYSMDFKTGAAATANVAFQISTPSGSVTLGNPLIRLDDIGT